MAEPGGNMNQPFGGEGTNIAPLSGRAHPGTVTSLGAIGSAFLASLCCIGPVLFVTLGVGAGLASQFEPLRPFFTFLTVALLGVGFYTVYGRKGMAGPDKVSAATASSTSEAGASCAVPRDRKRDKVLLWVATLIAVVLLTVEQWSLWFV